MQLLTAACTCPCWRFGVFTVPRCDASLRYEALCSSPHRKHDAQEVPSHNVLDAVFVVDVPGEPNVPGLHHHPCWFLSLARSQLKHNISSCQGRRWTQKKQVDVASMNEARTVAMTKALKPFMSAKRTSQISRDDSL